MKLNIDQNQTFRLENSEPEPPRQGYSRLRVKACGICGSDIPRALAGTAYHYPIVLGHEFAGTVEDSTNPALIGKRACVFPILPCGTCAFCRREKWANCIRYDYYGSRRDGGMQDTLLIKDSNLVLLPDSVSEEAGAMVEPTAVCLHAVRKANITPDSTVTVYGAGTIGLLCGMWAKAFGAKAVHIAEPDAQRSTFAATLGFAASGNEQPDVVIDASGASGALNDAIDRIRPFGRIVLVGNPSGDTVFHQKNYSLLLRKQLTLCGSWNSDRRTDQNDWQDSVDAIASGKITPQTLITHRFPLEKAADAFRLIRDKAEPFNKIMVVMQ